jgi:hypothetical protein
MSSPEKFAKDMRSLAAAVEAAAPKAVRAVALQTLAQVTVATPVDTGRARANWIVSVGAPSQLEKPWPDKRGSGGRAASGAISDGTAVLTGAPKATTVFVQNNLPYIRRLNAGWSKKAPAGFVERAIKSAIAALTKARIFR